MPDVQIFAMFGTNAPRLLGSRTLINRRSAVRDTAGLLREIAEALNSEATFLEITEDLGMDE